MRARLLPAFRSRDAGLLVRAVAALVFISALFTVVSPKLADAGFLPGVHCLSGTTAPEGPALPADHGCSWCVATSGFALPPPPAHTEAGPAGFVTIVLAPPSEAAPPVSPADKLRQPRAPPIPS